MRANSIHCKHGSRRGLPLMAASLLAMALAFSCTIDTNTENGNSSSSLSDSSSSDEISNSSSSGEGISNGSSSSAACNGETHYLGYGYDVIRSGYINRGDVKVAYPILDQDRMCEDGVIAKVAHPGQQAFEVFTGSSIKEFYEERNSSISLSLSAGIKKGLFSGKFKTEFSYSDSASQNNTNTAYYSRIHSYRYTQDDYIKYAAPENLSKYLTEYFVNDLKNKTASEILDRYGTHVFIRYFKGGSLEANYTYIGSNADSRLTSNAQVTAAVLASYAGFSGEASVSASNSNSSAKKELEDNSSFKYYTHGGKALGSTSMDNLKNEYGDWTSSIADNADICGIGDFGQSFIAIWEFAKAAGEASKAAELEEEFLNRAREHGSTFPLPAKNFREEYEASATVSLSDIVPASVDIAKVAWVEVYALGAGGGGQGGNRSKWITGNPFDWIQNDYGTGGSGGGGAAAYMKLSADESLAFDITVGKGGAGGNGVLSDETTTWESGKPGVNGENTSVTVGSTTLTAEGGRGAGGSGQEMKGGVGGETLSQPANLLAFETKKGNSGDPGKHKADLRSTNRGGSAAKIEIGSENPFGGGSGAKSGDKAEAGGGGYGGYQNNPGGAGGNGKVAIVVTYFE